MSQSCQRGGRCPSAPTALLLSKPWSASCPGKSSWGRLDGGCRAGALGGTFEDLPLWKEESAERMLLKCGIAGDQLGAFLKHQEPVVVDPSRVSLGSWWWFTMARRFMVAEPRTGVGSQLRRDRPRKQCLWRSDKTSCNKPRKILALLMLLGLDKNLEMCLLTFQAALVEELPDSAIQQLLFPQKRRGSNVITRIIHTVQGTTRMRIL